jgi:hypothetical protein
MTLRDDLMSRFDIHYWWMVNSIGDDPVTAALTAVMTPLLQH